MNVERHDGSLLASSRSAHQLWMRPRSILLDALLILTAIAVTACLVWSMGVERQATPDELVHLFISGINPITRIWDELQADAHPPLHYLVTRACMQLGDSLLWPRLGSLLPAFATLALFYFCLRSLALGRLLSLLGTLLLATSQSFLFTAMSIRGYSLATAALLLVLLQYIFLIQRPEDWTRARTRLLLLAALVAAATLWASLFVLFCLGVLFVTLIATSRDYRRRLWEARRSWLVLPEWTGVVVVGSVLGWYYERTLGSHFFLRISNLHAYYSLHGESLFAFARRSLPNEVKCLVPLTFIDDRYLLVGFLVCAVLAAVLAVRCLRSASAVRRARGLLVLVGLSLLALLFSLGFLRGYPFGGTIRHQSIVLPFLVLALVFVCDGLIRVARSRAPWMSLASVAFAVSLCVMGARSALGMRFQSFYRPLYRHCYALPPSEPMYLTQLHLLGFYEDCWQARWDHVRTVTQSTERFQVSEGGIARQIYRASTMMQNFQVPLDERFFSDVHKVLVGERLKAIWTVWQAPSSQLSKAETEQHLTRALPLARKLGVGVENVTCVSGGSLVFRIFIQDASGSG